MMPNVASPPSTAPSMTDRDSFGRSIASAMRSLFASHAASRIGPAAGRRRTARRWSSTGRTPRCVRAPRCSGARSVRASDRVPRRPGAAAGPAAAQCGSARAQAAASCSEPEAAPRPVPGRGSTSGAMPASPRRSLGPSTRRGARAAGSRPWGHGSHGAACGRPERHRVQVRPVRCRGTGAISGSRDPGVSAVAACRPARGPASRVPDCRRAVARARPEVDPEMAREMFHEAATLLDNGLALDGLDDHDPLRSSRACAPTWSPRIPAPRYGHGPVRCRRRAGTSTTRRPCRRPTWSPPPSCSCDAYRRPMVPTSMDLPLCPVRRRGSPRGRAVEVLRRLPAGGADQVP